MLGPVRTRKTGEAVAGALRERIASGELRPGDRLPPEDQLLGHLRVARNTLREGLRILESEGIIEVRRGRYGGPYVTEAPLERLVAAFDLHLQLAGATIGDLDQARLLIEPQLAGSLAAIRTDEELEVLHTLIADASAASERGDLHAYGVAVSGLHRAIVERGGNLTLATVGRLLYHLVEETYRVGLIERPGRDARTVALRSYRKLYNLIESRDSAAAERHWRRQMERTAGHGDPARTLRDMFR